MLWELLKFKIKRNVIEEKTLDWKLAATSRSWIDKKDLKLMRQGKLKCRTGSTPCRSKLSSKKLKWAVSNFSRKCNSIKIRMIKRQKHSLISCKGVIWAHSVSKMKPGIWKQWLIKKLKTKRTKNKNDCKLWMLEIWTEMYFGNKWMKKSNKKDFKN